ncbi:hypothetical protein JCM19294_1844 [Nonlabens tegetincola]|uniref:Uncharacterized protein n=1 Tax=Nonlabens tegetincola TaxID=323273 RepID=A0A090QLD4_9FLAO|nr:hypothetical protein JCM19294_1844 [Nonlabens tegetincola]
MVNISVVTLSRKRKIKKACYLVNNRPFIFLFPYRSRTCIQLKVED